MPFFPNPLANELAERAAIPLAVQAAEAAAIAAQSIAPVDTGAYQSTIRAEATPDGAVVRAGGEGVDYAVYVEVGTSDTPAFHVLTRGVEAAGLRLSAR